MRKQIWHPGKVLWSGENSFMRTRQSADADDTTRVSHWRTVHSPHGEGHALFIVCDRDGDGLGEDDVQAIFTDNPDMASWLDEELMRNPFWIELSLDVIEASFSFSGDTRTSRTEHVVAEDISIDLTWTDFGEPGGFEVRGDSEDEIDLYSLLIPAHSVEVLIDGKPAVGSAYTSDTGGRETSTCCLAFSETWMSPPAP